MSVDILKLSSFGLLQIAGPDAEKFLQGQVTCDVQATTAEHWRSGAHCNHKGRMIANFLISRPEPDRFVICAPRDIITTLKASLDKYIVFSKAETQDLTESHKVYGVIGSEANHWYASHNGSPTTVAASVNEQQLICWSEGSDDTLESLQSHTSDNLWQQADITSGRGWVTTETTEEFLPQMLNLDCDAIAGISFKKGCYTGQEIVARMHYKGQTKKRLYAFEGPGNADISIGSSIYTGASDSVIGTVLNVSKSDTRTLLLAVASNDAIAENSEFFGADQAQKLHQIDLPYAINS